jgi:sirohydrochlorin ferrochelatase
VKGKEAAVAGADSLALTDCGLLVVGHGTANPQGAEECRHVAALIAAAVGAAMPVELGFLELIEPTIDAAVARLAARGCRRVVAAPLLLFTAGHAIRDVPEAVAAATTARRLEVRQSAALGEHPAMLALSRQRRAEVMAGRVSLPPAETRLLMIGRGASDPTAGAQLQSFADASLVGDEIAAGWPLSLGFCAAARPTLDEAVAAVGDPGWGSVRRIVVQPHLLFRGHVEDQVSAAVGRGRAARPDVEWLQAPRLGADALVAQAVVGRAAEALAAWDMEERAGGKAVSPSPA